MKKRSIPPVPTGLQPRDKFDAAVKEDLEILMGQRGGRIAELPDGASTADIIAKINEILTRLQ